VVGFRAGAPPPPSLGVFPRGVSPPPRAAGGLFPSRSPRAWGPRAGPAREKSGRGLCRGKRRRRRAYVVRAGRPSSLAPGGGGRDRADSALRQLTDGKHRGRELLLRKLVQEIGLVLRCVDGSQQLDTFALAVQARVVSGGDRIRAKRARMIDKGPELDLVV